MKKLKFWRDLFTFIIINILNLNNDVLTTLKILDSLEMCKIINLKIDFSLLNKYNNIDHSRRDPLRKKEDIYWTIFEALLWGHQNWKLDIFYVYFRCQRPRISKIFLFWHLEEFWCSILNIIEGCEYFWIKSLVKLGILK